MYHPRGYVRPEDGGMMVEYDSIVNHVTLWNVAVERQIQVKGPDAADFANFVITRDASVVAGLHVFTFNQVAATEAWRARLLAQLREGGADPSSSPTGPAPTS